MKLQTLGGIVVVWTLLNAALLTPIGGYQLAMTQGDSMEPTLKGCEVALIDTNPNPEQIEEGDIIAFDEDGKRVMHRVVQNKTKIGDGGPNYNWRAKGDNARYVDKMVHYEENLVGEVEAVYRPPTCS